MIKGRLLFRRPLSFILKILGWGDLYGYCLHELGGYKEGMQREKACAPSLIVYFQQASREIQVQTKYSDIEV